VRSRDQRVEPTSVKELLGITILPGLTPFESYPYKRISSLNESKSNIPHTIIKDSKCIAVGMRGSTCLCGSGLDVPDRSGMACDPIAPVDETFSLAVAFRSRS